ncbi:MAG: response regulator [Myxococcota bacterium]
MINHTVLIVEDSNTMRHLLVYMLKRLRGVSTDEANDGLAALRKVQKNRYDLIITDINMPLMDGFKLLSLIRHADPEVPIIVLTTEGGEADRERAMALGANAYLTKPIQAPTVDRVCRELLKIT